MQEQKTVSVDSLIPTDNNPRIIKDERFMKLCASIKSFPQMMEARPIVIDEERKLLGGNQRLRGIMELGMKTIPESWVHTMLGLSDYQKREFIIKDNVAYGEWDYDLIKAWDSEDLNDWAVDLSFAPSQVQDWSPPAVGEAAEPTITPEEAKSKLHERFIIPPFSVFDTQQGYWGTRKRIWKALGIKSEEGRKDNLLKFSDTILQPDKEKRTASRSIQDKRSNLLGMSEHLADPEFYSKKTAHEKVLGHEISSEDFILSGAYIPNMNEWASGTSIFDPVLCEVMYRWFCTEGGAILDPFAGGSVRGIVAAWLGYHYTGVDLRPEQVDANNIQAAEILDSNHPVWYSGDSKDVRQLSCRNAFDFVFSCPPYHDLEKYSDNPLDLSNMKWDEFIAAYEVIIRESLSLLRPNRFAAFVIQEIRSKNGTYKNFISETIRIFEANGAKYFNEIILVNQSVSLPIRTARQFNAGRKIGKKHQNILVFYKGDPKEIKNNFSNNLDFSGIEILEQMKTENGNTDDGTATD